MFNRSFRPGLAMAAVILAACGDSTGPQTMTSAQFARHVDSLAIAADTGMFGGARAAILGSVEEAPALGASPSRVVVTTPSGTSTWQGFVSGSSSGFSIVAYSDDNLTHVIFAMLVYSGFQTQETVSMVAGDTLVEDAGSGTITAKITAEGGPCVAAGGYQNPYARFAANCSLASFQASLVWTLPIVGQVSIAASAFNGIDLK